MSCDPAARPTVLIVDDTPEMVEILVAPLSHRHEIIFATSGRRALELMETSLPDLILLDINMPEISGLDPCRSLKNNPATKEIPVIFLTGCSDSEEVVKGFEIGAVDYVTKPFRPNEVLARVTTHLQLRQAVQVVETANTALEAARQVVLLQKDELTDQNSRLKTRVIQQAAVIRSKLEEAQCQHAQTRKIGDEFVQMLTDILEQRHHLLGKHSRSVAALAASMAATLGLPEEQCEVVRNAALLHDIGLICMPDRVIMYQGVLSSDDFVKYRNHPVRGQEIISIMDELQSIGILIRHHHEEYAGSGYPDGLTGKWIPLGSRIIHLASFIDDAYSLENGIDAKYKVAKRLASGMGTLFDPELSAAANLAVKNILIPPLAQPIDTGPKGPRY